MDQSGSSPHRTSDARHGSQRKAIVALSACLLLYGLAALAGLPQRGTELSLSHGPAVDEHAAATEQPSEAIEVRHEVAPLQAPPVWMVLPFLMLLGAIATFPLIPAIEHWWESNLHRFYLAAGLAALTLLYYLLLHNDPVEQHFLGHRLVGSPSEEMSGAIAWTVLQNALFAEYLPFIVLLFSLFTICGGIRIEGDLPAHPITNTAIIGIGAVLASAIGTTGAAMLLIRLLLETNSERKHVRHTAVFFIFAVCNCGGCLTPLGDPPLFLGYLEGVPFFWTFHALWPAWLFVNGSLLAIYWAWDRFVAYPREAAGDIARDERQVRAVRFSGAGLNSFCLAGVIASVAILDPSKAVPGTDWHPWLYLREVVQLGLVLISLAFGSAEVRERNGFSYAAIVEVAALFNGIFVCMQPALQILGQHGPALGLDSPQKFFWATGSLSSVLDNAPTYLVFFKTAQTLDPGSAPAAGVAYHLLAAISMGAVFLGAMTYIGNGPNFMVKAIAEKSGVAMPSFFGYVGYSVTTLLPLFLITSWLFL